MVFDKNVFFFVSLQPSKIAFLLLSIYSISHFLAVRVSLQKKKKVVFTPLLSTQHQACPLFKAFFHPLASRCTYNAHPTTKKKEIDSQPTPPNPPLPARPAGQKPLHLQSYTIYILYFVVIAQKVFNDLELTRTISLISLSKLPLFFWNPGSLKIKISSIFKRLNIARESPKSLPASTIYIYYIQYILYYPLWTPFRPLWVPLFCSTVLGLKNMSALSNVFITNQNCSSLYFQIFIRPMLFKINVWIVLVNFHSSLLNSFGGIWTQN